MKQNCTLWFLQKTAQKGGIKNFTCGE